VQNFELARLFYEMATLLEVRNESVFRVRAYQRAAQMLESLTEDIVAVTARGGLQKLPGIGKDLAVRVEEFLHTGRIDQLDQMRRDVPPRFLTLLEIRGLGPRTAKLLWDRLGVDSVERLEELCHTKEILNVAGIREKTRENILKGIAIWRAGRTRTLLPAARAVAEQVASALRAHGGVERLEVAGSLRRMRETVKDVDILVTSTEPARVIGTLTSLPSVTEVIARGDTRVSVRHQDGLQVDLRVVEPTAFGAALQYFTGSKDHNVRVRELAKRRGLTISEYGVFEEKSGTRVAGETEDEVYAAVGLPWIPPELREARNEFDLALAGRLPKLLEVDALRGDLHMHTTATDGRATLEEMVEAAHRRGYEYVAITDHSKRVTMARGLDAERIVEHWREIDRLNQKVHGITILKGVELDILEDGTLDLPDEVLAQADWVIAAVHYGQNQPREQITRRIVGAIRNPHVTAIAHPTGRLIGKRKPYEFELDTIFKEAADHGCWMEVDGQPSRLDLDDVGIVAAREHGIPIVVDSDAHSVEELAFVEFGVYQARRAGLEAGDVANTRPLAEFRKLLRH
jgi:DNA polymerase (family 10)